MTQNGVKYYIVKEILVRTAKVDLLTETGAFMSNKLIPLDASSEMPRLFLAAMANPPAPMSELSI